MKNFTNESVNESKSEEIPELFFDSHEVLESADVLPDTIVKRVRFYDHTSPFVLVQAGYSKKYKQMIVRPYSSLFCIEYITGGKGIIICDNKTFKVEKGDIFILPNGSQHKYLPSAADPYSKIHINVSGSFVEHCIQDYGLSDTLLVHDLPIKHLFDEFYDAACEKIPTEQRSAKCARIFLKIIQNIAAAPKSNDVSPIRSVADNIKHRIDSSDSYNINLNDICNEIYCTKTIAIRSFEKKFGIPPYRYIIKKRVEKAKELLLNTDYSISKIASLLDFCSASYFSRFFKKETGMLPSEYKKSTERIMTDERC